MSVLRRRLRAALAASTLGALAVTAACAPAPGADPSGQQPTDRLEVISWWTSSSEKPALDSLLTAYRTAHPEVTVVDAAVAGGGGSNAQVVLAARLREGDPPDVWQTFVGEYTRAWARAGRLADVSSVWRSSGLDGAVPTGVLEASSVDGKRLAVPSGSHRSNVLFYNTKVLADAGVTVPASGYTMAAFIADLATVKKAGMTPLCLGAKDPFTSAQLFESILLAEVGVEGWASITSDRFDWSGPKAKAALATFGTVLDHADPAASGLSWDQATKRLAGGECAFEAMNDSAYGELVADGASEETIGYVPFPGTDAAYVAVIDAFVVAKDAANGRNAVDLLAVIADKDQTLAFNRLKGSVPVRTDVDTASLSPYQQSAARALREKTFLLSIVHGEAKSPTFQQGFYDAVATYRTSRDPAAFVTTLTSAVASARGVNAP